MISTTWDKAHDQNDRSNQRNLLNVGDQITGRPFIRSMGHP